MEKKLKTAVIGDKNYVSLYSAAGVRVSHATDRQTAVKSLNSLVSSGYSVIFITEGLYKECEDSLKKYLMSPYPIIIAVPDESSDGEYSKNRISANIKKAIGSDII